jgi:hypothetical protein
MNAQKVGGNWFLLRSLFERKENFSDFFKIASDCKLLADQNDSVFPFLYGVCLEFGVSVDKVLAEFYYQKRVKLNEPYALMHFQPAI